MMTVRMIADQPPMKARRVPEMIARPRSPASRSAKGSRKSASGRRDSAARKAATMYAVSETSSIAFDMASVSGVVRRQHLQLCLQPGAGDDRDGDEEPRRR